MPWSTMGYLLDERTPDYTYVPFTASNLVRRQRSSRPDNITSEYGFLILMVPTNRSKAAVGHHRVPPFSLLYLSYHIIILSYHHIILSYSHERLTVDLTDENS